MEATIRIVSTDTKFANSVALSNWALAELQDNADFDHLNIELEVLEEV